ncbi:spermidine synthase [Herpetosiphon geysericola]|uniref:Spermidine synthase n=1 Tax=Herpetosiphon geysericola TaxID=70996 RepID=A0A0P6Y881_9CHLR|nr:spermidine synthase [Herpetosiphon geysericola]
MPLLGRIAASIGWTLVSVLIFYGGARLYDLLDPIDYREEIKRGNVAAAIQMAAVTIALAAIVIMAVAT